MPDLYKMTKAELVQYAAENDVTLYPSDNTKAEIIARIEAHEALNAVVTAQTDVTADFSAPVDETVQSEESDEQADEQTAQIGTYEKRRLTISNPTLSVRGIMLNKGVMFLDPGEEKLVPEEDEAEVRALFKTESFQAIVDSGLLRFSGIGDNELVEQETPEPPSSLIGGVQVGSTGLVVGANSTRQYDPSSSSHLTAAGYMPIG